MTKCIFIYGQIMKKKIIRKIAKQNPSLMNYIEDMDDLYYLEIPFSEIRKDLMKCTLIQNTKDY